MDRRRRFTEEFRIEAGRQADHGAGVCSLGVAMDAPTRGGDSQAQKIGCRSRSRQGHDARRSQIKALRLAQRKALAGHLIEMNETLKSIK